MLMTSEQYDKLQKIMRLFIPLITFLTAIGDIWGFRWMGLVTATIAALNIFLGQVLNASSKKYKESKEPDPEVLEDEDEEGEE